MRVLTISCAPFSFSVYMRLVLSLGCVVSALCQGVRIWLVKVVLLAGCVLLALLRGLALRLRLNVSSGNGRGRGRLPARNLIVSMIRKLTLTALSRFRMGISEGKNRSFSMRGYHG